MLAFRKAAMLAGLAAIVGAPAVASADVPFPWEFSLIVTGDNPTDDAPWAILECDDSVADTVVFTLTNTSTHEGQFLSELLLNFDGTLPGDFAWSSTDDSVVAVSWGTDAFVDAGSAYDIQINFDVSGSGDRVLPGESVSWTFTGSDLDCDDFIALSSPQGDNDAYYALLHLQGVGEDNEFSTKVAPVPEPASMAALGLGALGLLARRRRKA